MEAPHIFSVSEFLEYVNEFLVEQRVVIEGEIFECKTHPTGIYITLKDDTGSLRGYIHPQTYRMVGVPLEAGMKIKVFGWPSIYKPKGEMSFKVQSFELAGEGTLRKAYEALKTALEKEGLFAQKRPLPQFIDRIGVITSRTGAVIDDFRTNLEACGAKIFLYDTRVEGAQAVDGVAEGIERMNTLPLDLDVLVIMRGGGGLEEMQAFNNERVARALYASKIPTICGIGHDRDVPIASLVGDAMTSTPTAAAVLINNSWRALRTDIPLHTERIKKYMERAIAAQHHILRMAGGTLTRGLEGMFATYHRAGIELVRAGSEAVARTRRRVEERERYLEAVNPERNLKLGYSILFDDNGKVVKDSDTIQIGNTVRARLAAGSLTAKVETIEHDHGGKKDR